EEIAQAVGMDGKKMQEMYRLLAIAKYDDRYVIPTASPETPRGIQGLDPFGNVDPIGAAESLNISLGEGAPEACGTGAPAASGRVSLASWNPGERPDSMFPDSRD
ncbi:MAG: nitrate reductase subunit beta, partial [Corynebacterium sp.]|nr:nitrate reductase subunit beta [Corynebacterium sp.]